MRKRPNNYQGKGAWPEIDGKQWLDQGDGHGVRVIKEGAPVPKEACINVPHPVRRDLRIIFCVIASAAILACIIVPVL